MRRSLLMRVSSILIWCFTVMAFCLIELNNILCIITVIKISLTHSLSLTHTHTHTHTQTRVTLLSSTKHYRGSVCFVSDKCHFSALPSRISGVSVHYGKSVTHSHVCMYICMYMLEIHIVCGYLTKMIPWTNF